MFTSYKFINCKLKSLQIIETVKDKFEFCNERQCVRKKKNIVTYDPKPPRIIMQDPDTREIIDFYSSSNDEKEAVLGGQTHEEEEKLILEVKRLREEVGMELWEGEF